MADVDVMHTVTEVKKTRKVKKTTKRRESSDQGSETIITEIDQTTAEQNDKGYVLNCNAFTIFGLPPECDRRFYISFDLFFVLFSFLFLCNVT